MANPLMELNVATGHYRTVLRDGNPVEDDSPIYELLSLLYEAAGWAMEETPREGSLLDEFPESNANTPSQFKDAVERRCQPLLDNGTLVSAACTSVREVVERAGSAIFFNLLYKQPGQRERTAQLGIGT